MLIKSCRHFSAQQARLAKSVKKITKGQQKLVTPDSLQDRELIWPMYVFIKPVLIIQRHPNIHNDIDYL